MTNETFCELYSQFYGEPLDNVNQIAHIKFETGEELKEFIDFVESFISKVPRVLIIDNIDPSQLVKLKAEIMALYKNEPFIITRSKDNYAVPSSEESKPDIKNIDFEIEPIKKQKEVFDIRHNHKRKSSREI